MSDGWKTNAITLRLPVAEVEAAQSMRRHLDDMMRESMRRRLYPWEYTDRNPFPSFEWWPLIDKAIWLRKHGKQEATDRLSAAWSIVRHGIPERDDW